MCTTCTLQLRYNVPVSRVSPLVLQQFTDYLSRYKYCRDGSIALLFYNNGHTDKLGYCGRLVVWLMLGKLSQDQRSLVW